MVHLGELSEPVLPPDELDEEQKEFARKVFAGTAQDSAGGTILACYFCGGIHTRVFGVDLRHQVCCPRVRSAQYDIGGVLLGVDFWPNGRWEDGVIFPADVAGPGGETPAP